MPPKRDYAPPCKSRMYANLLRRAEPITRQEERALFLALRAGDESAREKLVMANLRFAFSKAIGMAPPNYDADRLVSAANVGLLRAIDLFDVDSGNKLISYAVHWIKVKVQEELQKDRLISIPLNQLEKMREYRRTEADLYTHGRTPTHDGVVEAMGTKYSPHLDDALAQAGGVASVEAFKGNGDNGSTSEQDFYERYADPDAIGADEYAQEVEVSQSLDRALKCLRGDLFAIVRLYYGLRGAKPHTLEEIGDMFGVTRERIRQLKKHAEERLAKNHPSLAVHLSA